MKNARVYEQFVCVCDKCFFCVLVFLMQHIYIYMFDKCHIDDFIIIVYCFYKVVTLILCIAKDIMQLESAIRQVSLMGQ